VNVQRPLQEKSIADMMTAKSFLALFAIASMVLPVPGAYMLHAYQATAKLTYDPPQNLARTDFPDWPYPKGVHVSQSPDDGKLYRVPGSTKSFTDTQINRNASTVDWFPESHPVPPPPVIAGKEGAYRACGECHLMNGGGKPDTANLQGLPVAYFLQQLEDMKNDKRHGSVAHASITSMIPIAKSIDAGDARLAADYFHSIRPVKTVRVIETDIVPVTHPGPHSVQLVEFGASEPIGKRIIEVPEDAERTLLRDPSSGFIAYVPPGSIMRGEALARTGNGKAVACATCHGSGLKGTGDFPALAGHSPTATARQLYDFKSGTREGQNAAVMKSVVTKLTDQDIVDVTAYIASLQP
jgi:cytochrome c553